MASPLKITLKCKLPVFIFFYNCDFPFAVKNHPKVGFQADLFT